MPKMSHPLYLKVSMHHKEIHLLASPTVNHHTHLPHRPIPHTLLRGTVLSPQHTLPLPYIKTDVQAILKQETAPSTIMMTEETSCSMKTKETKIIIITDKLYIICTSSHSDNSHHDCQSQISGKVKIT